MNTRDSAFAYHQTTAFGASAVGQVVALYERILRDLREAAQALETGQIEKRVNTLNHTLTIIGELQGVLDFEQGGEAAQNLNNFYNVARAMVLKAGVMSSAETLQELVSMFTRLRSAWAQAERTVTPSEPAQRLRLSSQRQSDFSPQETPSPETTFSSSGGWRA